MEPRPRAGRPTATDRSRCIAVARTLGPDDCALQAHISGQLVLVRNDHLISVARRIHLEASVEEPAIE
ncbi:MAG: hypothetical protein Q8M01_04675 [Rubrivivax sp.]|nr:hypothetical protein [Rubrivivax sp.]